VRLVSYHINDRLLRALTTRSGADLVSGDW
jgi:hypothetical protein